MVKVTDADREAAARLATEVGDEWIAEPILAGHRDRFVWVQAFARHRIAGAKAALEKAAELCNERGAYEQEGFGLSRATQNYFRARDAIRNIDPEECE